MPDYTYNSQLESPEARAQVFNDLPDQFTKYEELSYNPLDYYTASGEFNLALFNKTFREDQIKRIEFYRMAEAKRLEELNQEANKTTPLHLLSIGQIFINMKDAIFGICTDLSSDQPITTDILLKNNRLFYVGLLMVIIYLLYLLFSNLFSTAME